MRSFEILFDLFYQTRPNHARNAAGSKAQHSTAQHKCDHMTAQEPCSAVAMTLAAGGEAGAEAVVQEDPAVLRLRRAMPLPPAMGIA